MLPAPSPALDLMMFAAGDGGVSIKSATFTCISRIFVL